MERKQYKVWPIWSRGSSQEDIQRENDKKRNERRREKRAEQLAQIRALPPRDAAVLATIDRLRRDFRAMITVRTIIDATSNAEAETFINVLHNFTSFRRVVQRSLDRLEAVGRVEKHGNGWGPRAVFDYRQNS